MPKVPLNRNQARAIASLAAAQEKVDDLRKMLGKAERDRDRTMARAWEHGIGQAEMARLCGMTKGNVWQKLRALGVVGTKPAPADEPEGEQE